MAPNDEILMGAGRGCKKCQGSAEYEDSTNGARHVEQVVEDHPAGQGANWHVT